MAALVWVMMGLALWHFTIFLPDHFWAGIVGAFLGAVLGSLIFGFLIHGFYIPGQSDTDLLTAIEAIPGALLGMGLIYWIGLRQERAHPAY
jgi:membrane protein DedA with SNARE-associated domain